MASAKTQKETIEYNQEFLDRWNEFCDKKGYVKRAAAHACREAFMTMDPETRERIMGTIAQQVAASRERRRK